MKTELQKSLNNQAFIFRELSRLLREQRKQDIADAISTGVLEHSLREYFEHQADAIKFRRLIEQNRDDLERMSRSETALLLKEADTIISEISNTIAAIRRAYRDNSSEGYHDHE